MSILKNLMDVREEMLFYEFLCYYFYQLTWSWNNLVVALIQVDENNIAT